MAISVTQIGTSANTAGATLTLGSVNAPAGALIGILTAENSGSGTSQAISDGGVNTGYAQVTGMPIVTNGMTNFWYKENINALSGATITYTKQNSGRDTVMIAFYATVILSASSLDATTSVASAFTATTTPSKTSGTPTQAGELMVAFAGGNSSLASFTKDGTWTDPTTNFLAQGAAWLAWAYQVNAGTGTKTWAPTLGSSVAGTIGISGFKAGSMLIVPNLAMMGL